MSKILHKIADPLYLLVWLGISLFMALHHEPFSDEAQAYLIARDASLLDVITDVARAEGHPLLWYVWLKIWLLFNIDYSYISFASLIPSFLGVWLFIKKAPFPPLARYLFPLTYFIFYQYNIVARGYSFLLLFISLAAVYYPKRKEHPWLYIFILMLLGQVEVYTFILAGGLFVLGLYEDWKAKEINWTAVYIMALYGVLTVAMMYPNTDNKYLYLISYKLEVIIVSVIRALTCGLITFDSYDFQTPINLLIGAVYFCFVFVELFNIYRKETIFLLIPIILFSCFVYKLWHSGIVLLTVMLIMWLQPQRKLSKELKFCLIILFSIQIGWSIIAFIKDRYGKYSVGQDVYTFLTEHNISLNRVQRLQFNTTSFCPYYGIKNCSYWDWKKEKFERKIERHNTEAYDAFIINAARYQLTPPFWDINQKDFGFTLKIFETQQFVGSFDTSEDETLYVYYREKADEN